MIPPPSVPVAAPATIAPTPPPPEIHKNEEFYKVESFLQFRKKKRGQGEYLVAWEGYPPSDNQWCSARRLQKDLGTKVYNKLVASMVLREK